MIGTAKSKYILPVCDIWSPFLLLISACDLLFVKVEFGKQHNNTTLLFFRTKSQGNKMLEGVEMAPFRSIDEFLTSESK